MDATSEPTDLYFDDYTPCPAALPFRDITKLNWSEAARVVGELAAHLRDGKPLDGTCEWIEELFDDLATRIREEDNGRRRLAAVEILEEQLDSQLVALQEWVTQPGTFVRVQLLGGTVLIVSDQFARPVGCAFSTTLAPLEGSRKSVLSLRCAKSSANR